MLVRLSAVAALILSLTLTLTLIVVSTSSPAAAAQEVAAPVPPQMRVITVAPADPGLRKSVDVNGPEDENEEGGDMPSAIYYYGSAKDDMSFLAITDESLCRRPSEVAVCAAFHRILSGPPPDLGTEVTGSRIGGAGYGSTFLARLDNLNLPGADRSVAFLAADSQDPPWSGLAVYIYAQRGGNLIELYAGAGNCSAPPRDSDTRDPRPYFRRSCVNRETLAAARAAGQRLLQKFRLKPAA
jgi:hypothetical protein